MSHTSQCMPFTSAIPALLLPSEGRVRIDGRAPLDFSPTGPFQTQVIAEIRERFGLVIVGDVPVIVRVFYGRANDLDDEREDVRLALDLERLGPVRLIAPRNGRVVVCAIAPGFDVWRDDLAAIDGGIS
jgi:hypothetical protein